MINYSQYVPMVMPLVEFPLKHFFFPLSCREKIGSCAVDIVHPYCCTLDLSGYVSPFGAMPGRCVVWGNAIIYTGSSSSKKTSLLVSYFRTRRTQRPSTHYQSGRPAGVCSDYCQPEFSNVFVIYWARTHSLALRIQAQLPSWVLRCLNILKYTAGCCCCHYCFTSILIPAQCSSSLLQRTHRSGNQIEP